MTDTMITEAPPRTSSPEAPKTQTVEEHMRGRGEAPPYKYLFPANFRTNDLMKDGFLESVAGENPDGYIIGIGGGGIWTMLDAMPQGVEPKGIVIAEIDPNIVASLRIMLEDAAANDSYDSFYHNFFEQSDEEFQIKVTEQARKDPILASGLERWGNSVMGVKTKSVPMSLPASGGNLDALDPRASIFANFSTIKKLIAEKKISINYTDFFDPQFIAGITTLPGYSDSTNTVFLTNALDYVQDRTFQNLKQLETQTKTTLFVDAPNTQDQYFTLAKSADEVIRLHPRLQMILDSSPSRAA